MTSWKIEHALYALVLILAAGVRLLNLGVAPFSDYEAGWALQALQVAGGEGGVLEPQPSYILLTGLMFYLLGSTDFLARFLPALAGSLLVLVPLPFRGIIGRPAALVMAFGLALDPGLAVASRQAGGPILALALILLAAAAAVSGRPVLAGVLAGLALLSGPQVFHGILILGLTWLAWRWFEDRKILTHPEAEMSSLGDGTHFDLLWLPSKKQGRKVLAWAVGTVLLVGTLFMAVPSGVGALARTVPAYFSSWFSPPEVTFLKLLAALVIYQPLALVFGLSGAVRAWFTYGVQAGVSRYLALWFAAALLLAGLYPGRQVSDLVWVLVPLWGLAAGELSRLLFPRSIGQNRWVSISMAVFLVSLMAFVWLNLAGVGMFGETLIPENLQSVWVVGFGALVMALLTILLVGLGWSWETSRWGLVLGATVSLGLLVLSNLWGSTHLRQNRVTELWFPQPGAGQAMLLEATLHDLAVWQAGHDRHLNVIMLADSPSLRWLLRGWSGAAQASGLALDDLPEVIVAYQGQETPSLAAAYRGQRFLWEEYPRWSGILPENWPRWLVFREAPRLENHVILWARADLFPGSESDLELEFNLIPDQDFEIRRQEPVD
jgi:hypothetical protein